MRDIASLPIEESRSLRGLLFDLDDTFLEGSRLVPESLQSLVELRQKGFLLIAVTGRPAAWAELAVWQWPIDAAVAENGGLEFYREGKRVHGFDRLGAERATRRAALAALVQRIQAEFPGLRPSTDSHLRLTDAAFDVAEHESVPPEVVAAAREMARESGAYAHVSSVHLHVSFDAADKATASVGCLSRQFGIDRTASRTSFAFIGDSGNDAACFAAFHTTIGVSNLTGRPSIPPRYITKRARSAGFAEAAQALCRGRE